MGVGRWAGMDVDGAGVARGVLTGGERLQF